LRRELRVNAGTPQKKQFLYAVLETARDQVVLDLKVLQEKFDRKIIVCLDSANFCGCHQDKGGPGTLQESVDSVAVTQIKLLAGASEDFGVSVALEIAHHGAPYQTTMASDVYGTG
jgi:hypothetical protein